MLISREEDGWHVNAAQVPVDYVWGADGYVGDFTPVPVKDFFAIR